MDPTPPEPQGTSRTGPPGRSNVTLGVAKLRLGESLIKALLFLCALVSVAVTAGIIYALVVPSIAFFREVPVWDYLFGTTWAPLFKPASFGVLPLVAGTLVVTVVACLVCLPLGLGAAVYLSEYAHSRTRRMVKPALELLAGIPTIIYGFFTLLFVSPLLQKIFPFLDIQNFNALGAGLVMGIMILPTVASLSEDAMSAVPGTLREAAYALGANRMTVAIKVVVPAALSGIVASFVLGISRAIGETMIVVVAAGGQPNLTWNPVEAMQTMTAFIAAAGVGDLPTGSTGYKTIFAVGATLFTATFLMNMLSIRFVRKYREVYS